ncbi:MAG: DUF2461 domain-containing protein [Bacteroidetes bacterium]|nr:DUF2461 domain-containing protein [Bacteroidota bacterium]
MANPYITPGLFQFFRDLRENNTREWFEDNRKQYEQHVKDPLLDLIADFAPLLAQLSPHYLAIPKASGGSLFRIHRDVRFSTDKRPYKTAAGIQFRHRLGKDAHAPGYYLHIEPGNVFYALGMWHPAAPDLMAIRQRIVDAPDEWEAVKADPGFGSTYAWEGESLKRAPKGFDPEHPDIEDLRRKDFIGVASLEEADAGRPDLLPFLASEWARGGPLMRFLGRAVDVPF